MSDIIDQQITGLQVAGLFETQSEESLTTDERQLISALLKRDDRVDLAVPDKMDAKELWRVLEVCSRVFLRVRHASGQLKLLIGRALAVIQNTPEVYTSRGFSSFDAFMTDEVRGLPKITGISRAELYKAKSVALSVGPGMNLEDARDLGFTKLQLIAGYSEPGTPTQAALIEAGKTDTIQQLRERIARSESVPITDMQWDLIQIQATKTQKKMFEEFVSNPLVKAYCETESQGMILQRMIEECQNEWVSRVQQGMVIDGEATEV